MKKIEYDLKIAQSQIDTLKNEAETNKVEINGKMKKIENTLTVAQLEFGPLFNAAGLQMKAPVVKREKKVLTKEEIKKEESETKEVLDRLIVEDNKFIVHDPALRSDPKLCRQSEKFQ